MKNISIKKLINELACEYCIKREWSWADGKTEQAERAKIHVLDFLALPEMVKLINRASKNEEE